MGHASITMTFYTYGLPVSRGADGEEITAAN
jgi:hypothetical protein